MNERLSPRNLATVREKGRHRIYFEPGGLLVTSSDLVEEIEGLRSRLSSARDDALEEAAAVAEGMAFEVVAARIRRLKDA